ncbi:peptidoglycan editing factor PgeF [Aliarcobacter vitoriensis]|uniref:Purine nucleoside phosphorylase n=1 Tax=Aliarcobacter vitoriensis TaxID=2011099 RepID=A0A366MX24_9BACT|nr:peptidoglycan editing factor PgeF [Aliarcobacter vitoriensis]RBQ30019.1 multicopper polyphenol oxidase [Aliarcobacter vitoriensis]
MKIIYDFTTSKDGNLAFHTGDDKNNVINNRQKLSLKIGYDYEKLVYMNQTHGNNVVKVDENSPKLIEDCDGIITNCKNLPLMVMVADCIPILMFDVKKGVVCAIHAGRNSTFLKIVQISAKKMIEEFACNKDDIKVILGPSIQKCCYEVSPELALIVKNSFGNEFVNNRNIDLQGINKKLLSEIGVTNIEISNICTKCSNKPYFSYRKDKNTGRFAGIIMIKD